MKNNHNRKLYSEYSESYYGTQPQGRVEFIFLRFVHCRVFSIIAASCKLQRFRFHIDIIHLIIYHFIMKTIEISDIDEMLIELPKKRIQEVRDFVGYLLDKEKKRKAFEERILKIERESDTVTFDSVEEAMNTIRNWEE